MATLVLSTVGTILGGRIGGAVGSLVGQTIDQQLFGPGAKHGPRLGDLSVQTSSYGSAIPKVFGRMRVAGTVVWATDLQENTQTQSTKGQPDTVSYDYSISMAVALSSRPIASVGRIWADGKLIRDADGKFAVPTGFRILDGSEDQLVDPLIAAIEGIDSTPAYRGIALAVFESLHLADFGNRIPFLTFEVVADSATVDIRTILGDVSENAIAAATDASIIGYAAYGSTMTAAVKPLVDLWDIPLFDDGFFLSTSTSVPNEIAVDETGCTVAATPAPRIERSQAAAASLPSSTTLAYYDPDREYQTGLARASVDSRINTTFETDLPAVLKASTAKALAETSLARRWTQRDRLKLRLPPAFMGLRPGFLLSFLEDPSVWRAEEIAIDGLAVVAELQPIYAIASNVPADPGRVVASTAAFPAPTTLAIIELPDDGTGNGDAPVVVIAATSSAKAWRAIPLQVEIGNTAFVSKSSSLPTIMGYATDTIGTGQSAVFDLLNSVDVELIRGEDWLESRDDDALAAGENLALLGEELIQFGAALPLGNGRFRLSRLLRGRRGTEWAMELHTEGDRFAMLDGPRVQRLPVTAVQKNAELHVRPCGLADASASPAISLVTGEAMRPPSPIRLVATWDSLGNLLCTWVRRSSKGWSWLDGVDAPLGCSTELYRATLTGAVTEIELSSEQPKVEFTAQQVAAIGIGEAELSVVQVGDLAISRPAIMSITINQD